MERLAQIALDSAYAADRMDDYRRISETVDDHARAPKAQIDELRVSQTTQRARLDNFDNDLQNTLTALQNLQNDVRDIRTAAIARDATIAATRHDVDNTTKALTALQDGPIKDIEEFTSVLTDEILSAKQKIADMSSGIETLTTETAKLGRDVSDVDRKQGENEEEMRNFGRAFAVASKRFEDGYLAKMTELETNLSEVRALKAGQLSLAAQVAVLQTRPAPAP